MVWRLSSSLASAENGQELAHGILRALQFSSEPVTLDFADVQLLTPSFANAMVMTLLARLTLDELRSRCLMVNRQAFVVESLSSAARRFADGIRLSNQAPVPA